MKNIIFLLLISSCAPRIKNFNDYSKASLLEAYIMPSKNEVLNGESSKVVILPFSSNSEKENKEIEKLKTSIPVEIENIISNDGIVKIIDRKSSGKLNVEMKLVELNENFEYEGPAIADYIISGDIASVEFSKIHIPSIPYFDAKNGTFIMSPAVNRFSSRVSGNVKIYKIPSLKVYKSFKFNGTDSKTTGESRISNNDEIYRNSLAQGAMRDAIGKLKNNLKNFFSKQGYILEKRRLNDDNIFKISVGSRNGIKHGDRIELYSKREDINILTNEKSIIKEKIGEGRVSDLIYDNFAWIVVKDKKNANKVRLGDTVKPLYKSFF